MKITLLALFILCTGAAFGQVGVSVLSNQPQVIEPVSHPQHADLHAMASESPLVGGGTYTYAQGEVPLWEFGSPYPEPTPLGDVARANRKQKQCGQESGSRPRKTRPIAFLPAAAGALLPAALRRGHPTSAGPCPHGRVIHDFVP